MDNHHSDPLYQDLSEADLRKCLQELHNFKESRLASLFRRDYELAKEQFIDIITGLAPESIKDFISREQAVGQLEQVKTALLWFDAKEEEITNLIKAYEKQ